MKRNLLIIISFLSLNLFSQNYTPFPEDSVYWIRKIDRNGGFGNISMCGNRGYQTFLYYSFEDTLINGMEYRLVKKSLLLAQSFNGSNITSYNINDALENAQNSFCYRNDSINKIVYAMQLGGADYWGMSKEFIWYDFNIKVGDTLGGDHSPFFFKP